MKSSLPSATKEDLERWSYFREMGCLACRLMGEYSVPEVHHLNMDGKAGQKRLGHDKTIPLCSFHHRNVIPEGVSYEYMALRVGPSLPKDSRGFRECFGADLTLLRQTNIRIAALKSKRVR